MNKVKSLLKFSVPFIVMTFFMVIANTMQIISFMMLRKLDIDSFAFINFGFYAITLLAVSIGAFERWMMINLSKLSLEKRVSAISEIFLRTRFVFPLFLLVFCIVLVVLYPQAWTLIMFSGLSMVALFFSIFPKSLIVSEENFVFLGFTTLIEPIFRLCTVFLFVQHGNVLPFFIGNMVSSIVTGVVCYVALKIKVQKSHVYSVEQSTEDPVMFKMSDILIQVMLQVGISIFWIADGLLLKNILNAQLYGTYVTYAYIMKFPLFITVSLINVLLVKNVLAKKEKEKFFKMMLLAIGISVAAFGSVAIFDIVMPGFIITFLGYARYHVPLLLSLISVAWAIHTILTILFTYALKTEMGPRLVLNISAYMVSFIIVLLTINDSLMHLVIGVIIQGAIFIFLTLLTQKVFLRKKW